VSGKKKKKKKKDEMLCLEERERIYDGADI
jgi:hypothetical protein